MLRSSRSNATCSPTMITMVKGQKIRVPRANYTPLTPTHLHTAMQSTKYTLVSFNQIAYTTPRAHPPT